jgi:hypothetical protein
MRADLCILRQANSLAYWGEAGVQGCRKLTASAREGLQYKLDGMPIAL